MSKNAQLRPLKRPIFIADFASVVPLSSKVEIPEASVSSQGGVRREGIRYNFPKADEVVAGGTSDGYCFRLVFAAGRLERTYEMVRAFLKEEGYGELPIPQDANELRLFRQPPKLRHQLSLFGDNGYVHNPLKILFPVPAGQRGALIVELYNEASLNHLTRFHRLK
jgi:hypothetical protein